VEYTLTPFTAGALRGTAVVHTAHSPSPLAIQICGSAVGAVVAVDESLLDFGLVRQGETMSATLTLRNTGVLPAALVLQSHWLPAAFTPQFPASVTVSDVVCVSFQPPACQLLPGAVATVAVTFTTHSLPPHLSQHVAPAWRADWSVRVCLGAATAAVIPVLAAVQQPRACFASPRIFLPGTRVGVDFFVFNF
jgi:hypothetical protein